MLEDIGRQLKEARLARRRSLEDLAAETHLKVSHLEALERGDEKALPEPVYIKGFIRKYAQAVGLDAEDLANSYWQTRPLPPAPTPSRELNAPWWLFPWILGAVLLAGLGYLWFHSTRPEPQPRPTPMATRAPSASPASRSATASPLLPGALATPSAHPSPHRSPSPMPSRTPSPSPKPSPSPRRSPSPHPSASRSPSPRPTFSPTPRPSAKPAATVSTTVIQSEEGGPPPVLALHATGVSEVAVRRHGREIYRTIMGPDQTETWPLEDELEISAVNGGVIVVRVGEQDLGPLGSRGKVARRFFKREAE